MNRLDYLKNYYENRDENSRLEPKRGRVEFLTTVHYIEKYLTPGMKIIEIGAGTGKYSHYFARKGYKVDAIELIEHNIRIFKENTALNEVITVTQGDAVDLKTIKSNEYDITLLLGPMYHLYEENEKSAALKEAIRVTKPGGIIFVAYVNNDMTMYQFCFQAGQINNTKYRNLINMDTFKCNSTPSEIITLYRKEEIDELMNDLKVNRLHYVGTDMLTHFIAKEVDDMDDATFDLYMKYQLYICERKDMVGASNHILDIFRKV